MVFKINVDELKGVIEKHQPETLAYAGINGLYEQARYMGARVYSALYKESSNEHHLVKHYRLTKSNNWLKSHGYTIRRKRR